MHLIVQHRLKKLKTLQKFTKKQLSLTTKVINHFYQFNLNAKFEIACFCLTVGLFGFLIATSPAGEGLRFFYLLFIPTVLVAARHGMTGAALCLAGTQGALVVILDWVDADPGRFTDYQTLMLFLSATGLVVGAGGALQSCQRHGGGLVSRNQSTADGSPRPRQNPDISA